MAKHSILTMSRGDEHRVADWLDYHHSIGFTNFHIILDNPIDDTKKVASDLAASRGFSLTIKELEPDGEYYDDLTAAERWTAIQRWKERHSEEIEQMGLPIVDPLSMRQYKYLPTELSLLSSGGSNDWLALIDVDEYIVLPGTSHISTLTRASNSPRLRFLNFNFDMSQWDQSTNVRAFTQRWSRKEVEGFGKGWQNRVKTIARCDHLLPLVSVHAISRGAFQILPPETARLHHYKYPNQGIDIPYNVTDETISINVL